MYFFGRSDTGKVRSMNQDCFRIVPLCKNAHLCVVCDGMGGAKSGNVASEYAVEVFTKQVAKYSQAKINRDGLLEINGDDACVILDDAARDANREVYKLSQSSADYQGMGTTLVAALICGDTVYVINVGDSRLYLISDNTITQITHDHSYVQHLVDNGSITPEDARSHPFRNRITRAIGTKNELETDIFLVELDNTDVCYLLLCTDGLSGVILPEDIYETVSSIRDVEIITDVEAELSDKAERLINAANAAGGPDNITAVLVKHVKEL